MAVTGPNHVYGLPIANNPEGWTFRVEVIPYICRRCGLVRLYAKKHFDRELSKTNPPEPIEGQE